MNVCAALNCALGLSRRDSCAIHATRNWPCTVKVVESISGVPIELTMPFVATQANTPSCELRTESIISITDSLMSNPELLVTTRSDMRMLVELVSAVSDSLKNHWMVGTGMPKARQVKLVESVWLMVVLSGKAFTLGGSEIWITNTINTTNTHTSLPITGLKWSGKKL